eukprot:365455-Chlamydomonas_euryale.AAC.6
MEFAITSSFVATGGAPCACLVVDVQHRGCPRLHDCAELGQERGWPRRPRWPSGRHLGHATPRPRHLPIELRRHSDGKQRVGAVSLPQLRCVSDYLAATVIGAPLLERVCALGLEKGMREGLLKCPDVRLQGRERRRQTRMPTSQAAPIGMQCCAEGMHAARERVRGLGRCACSRLCGCGAVHTLVALRHTHWSPQRLRRPPGRDPRGWLERSYPQRGMTGSWSERPGRQKAAPRTCQTPYGSWGPCAGGRSPVRQSAWLS